MSNKPQTDPPIANVVRAAKQTKDFKLKNRATEMLLTHINFLDRIKGAASLWSGIIDETDAHDAGIDALFQSIEKFNPKRGTFKSLYARIFGRRLIGIVRHKTSKRQGHDRTRSMLGESREEDLCAKPVDMDIAPDAQEMQLRLKAALTPYDYRILELHCQA